MTRTLVDDDFRVGQIHSDYVRRVQDFEVVGEAATVAEALAAVRTLHPDLLLLDSCPTAADSTSCAGSAC
ncbi:hypothetical protein AB0K74_30610 [Streptomyces sp. NPDC056159]|uniref:hypothetical protein n=1 Tax=Streptomyces sp. NPDC056159 TaxID=3155537 RepID=UPI003429B541